MVELIAYCNSQHGYTVRTFHGGAVCRIGTEHEKFAFNKADSTRATYQDIRHILEQVVVRHGWEAITEVCNRCGSVAHAYACAHLCTSHTCSRTSAAAAAERI